MRAQTERAAEQPEVKDQDYYNHAWGQPQSLKAPDSRPGYEQRWVRVSQNGVDDPDNLQKRMAQFWRPRLAETLPNAADYPSAFIKGGHLVIRGMMLCERPVDAGKAHRAYLRQLIEDQEARVKADLMDSSYTEHGMRPTVDANTQRVEVGRRITVAAD